MSRVKPLPFRKIRSPRLHYNEPVHIVADWGPGDMLVTMVCGVSAVVLDDGRLVPPIDFYLPEHGHKSDCEGCR